MRRFLSMSAPPLGRRRQRRPRAAVTALRLCAMTHGRRLRLPLPLLIPLARSNRRIGVHRQSLQGCSLAAWRRVRSLGRRMHERWRFVQIESAKQKRPCSFPLQKSTDSSGSRYQSYVLRDVTVGLTKAPYGLRDVTALSRPGAYGYGYVTVWPSCRFLDGRHVRPYYG